jgi:hypothetical protein
MDQKLIEDFLSPPPAHHLEMTLFGAAVLQGLLPFRRLKPFRLIAIPPTNYKSLPFRLKPFRLKTFRLMTILPNSHFA